MKVHNELHAQIGTIVDLKHDQKIQEANEAIKILIEQSNEVIELITQLEQEVVGSIGMNTPVLSSTPKTVPKRVISSPSSSKTAPAIKTYVKKEAKPAALQTPAPVQPNANSDDEWSDF
jgi:hypothetical protein